MEIRKLTPDVVLIDIRSLLIDLSSIEEMYSVYQIMSLLDIIRIALVFNGSMTYKQVILQQICLVLDHKQLAKSQVIEVDFSTIDAQLDVILERLEIRIREMMKGVDEDSENYSFLGWVDQFTVALKHWRLSGQLS